MQGLIRYVGRHHWGILATFIALGGTAYAASQLPPNSVGARQLRRHAVTLSKISPATKDRLRGRTGRTGRAGPAGPTGPSDGYASQTNQTSAPGAPTATSLTLPSGDYSVTGQCQASILQTGSNPQAFGLAQMILSIGPLPANALGNVLGRSKPQFRTKEARDSMNVPNHYGATPLTDTVLLSLSKGGTIYDTCANGIGGYWAAWEGATCKTSTTPLLISPHSVSGLCTEPWSRQAMADAYRRAAS